MNNFRLTVAIFTRDRPGHLERHLSIFKDLNGDFFKIIILDGSTENSFMERNQTSAKKFNASYLHESSLLKRFETLAEILNTEYVAYCSDDDVINPLYYSDAVKFLDLNQQYSLISGRTKCMSYNRRLGMTLEINHLENTYDIVLGDFVEKICRRDQVYQMGSSPTFYTVRRSSLHKLAAAYVINLKSYSGLERLVSILSLTEGGIGVIDTFMGYRDYSSVTTRDPERDDDIQYIPDADILVLQQVIHDRLLVHGYAKEFIDYAKSYAWPLPIRTNTGAYFESRTRLQRLQNMLYNTFFSRNPLMISLRKHQKFIL